jgi:hypothetical protein
VLSWMAGGELSLVTVNPEVRGGFPNCSKMCPIPKKLLVSYKLISRIHHSMLRYLQR